MGAPDQVARCPRCGYDLSGVVATWTEACPLSGVCSECGLEVAWRDVLGEQRLPGWSFEHAPWPAIGALAKTLWLAWRPRRFWRILRMDHPIRAGRLLVLGALLLVGSHAIVSINTFDRAWQNTSASHIRSPGVRPRLSDRQRALYAARAAAWGYRDHSEMVGLLTIVETYPRLPWLVWVTPGLLVTTAGGFVMLPMSLRKAKVRAAHIAQIMTYSLTLVPITWAMWWVLQPRMPYVHVVASMSSGDAPGATALVLTTTGATFWYWRVASRDYLRLAHPTGVAAALVGVGFLVCMLVGIFIDEF
jgi:hypothetical protein